MVTSSADDDDLSPVQQAVEEQVRPLSRSAVGSQQDAAPLVALVNHVIQILRSRLLEGFEAEVIQNEEFGSQVSRQMALLGTIRPSAVEVLEQFLGISKQGIHAQPGRFLSKCLGQMGFVYLGRTADYNV